MYVVKLCDWGRGRFAVRVGQVRVSSAILVAQGHEIGVGSI